MGTIKAAAAVAAPGSAASMDLREHTHVPGKKVSSGLVVHVERCNKACTCVPPAKPLHAVCRVPTHWLVADSPTLHMMI
jgi:hypothetical protein